MQKGFSKKRKNHRKGITNKSAKSEQSFSSKVRVVKFVVVCVGVREIVPCTCATVSV